MSVIAMLTMASLNSDKYSTEYFSPSTPYGQYTFLTLLVKTIVIGDFSGPSRLGLNLPESDNYVPGILAAGTVNGRTVDFNRYFTGSLLSTNRDSKPTSAYFIDSTSPGKYAKKPIYDCIIDPSVEVDDLMADPENLGTPGSALYGFLTHLTSYFGPLLGCSGYG